jgi:hypothetical protein
MALPGLLYRSGTVSPSTPVPGCSTAAELTNALIHICCDHLIHDSSQHQGLTSGGATLMADTDAFAKPRSLLSMRGGRARRVLLLIGASVIYLFLGDMREALVLFALML